MNVWKDLKFRSYRRLRRQSPLSAHRRRLRTTGKRLFSTQSGPGLIFMIPGRLRIEAIDKTAAYDS